MHHTRQHIMQLKNTYPSGAEEWLCPECGRHFIMQFQPDYERLDIQVLEAGDEMTSHVGSSGGVHIRNSEIRAVVDEEPVLEEPILSDELRMALDDALKDVDFGD